MSLAKVSLSGTVASIPEKRFTANNTAVVAFDLMVPAPAPVKGQPGEPFMVKVTCWSRLAEAVAEQVTIQSTVLVEGKLMIQSLQTPEGVAKKAFEVEAQSVHQIQGSLHTVTLEAAVGVETSRPVSAAVPAQPVMAGVVAAQPSSPMIEDSMTEDDIPF